MVARPAEDVVDTVVHDVVADGIVAPQADSDADLGADAVNAAHQDRSVAARGSVEAAEAANIADDLRAERGADGALDAAIGLFPRGNIHAGRGVGGGWVRTYPLAPSLKGGGVGAVPGGWRRLGWVGWGSHVACRWERVSGLAGRQDFRYPGAHEAAGGPWRMIRATRLG